MAKQKGFRLSDDTERKLRELVKLYNAKSENHAFELIINDIYKIKRSKALVPYEELDKQTKELKMAYMKVGELQGVLQERGKRLKEEKEQRDRLLQELETLKTEIEELRKSKKGFFARLFRS